MQNNINKENIEFMLLEGEGQYLEYKEKIDKKFIQEIVAFANAAGGKILLGVRDDASICGIKLDNKLRSQIQDACRNCDPRIFVDIDSYKNIVIIDVKEGIDKPYSCSNGFYMRFGANSQKLKRDEIFNFAIKTGKIRFDEQICDKFKWEDFDDKKFQDYLSLANINSRLDSKTVLTNLNVLTETGLTNAGVLFFAKEPSKYIRSSKVTCVLFQGDKRIHILDRKIFDDGLIENISNMINYVERHIDVKFIIKDLEREEIPQYPKEAYREAIVNAIMHRDYFDIAEDLILEVYKNKIIIRNPGCLFGLTIDELGQKSRTRNSLIADLLLRTSYVEKLGTGFLRMNDAMDEQGLENVKTINDEHSFALLLETTQETAQIKQGKTAQIKQGKTAQENETVNGKNETVNAESDTINGKSDTVNAENDTVNAENDTINGKNDTINGKNDTINGKNDTINIILKEISLNKKITYDELVIKVKKSRKTIHRYIQKMIKDNILLRNGGRKLGYWEIIKK